MYLYSQNTFRTTCMSMSKELFLNWRLWFATQTRIVFKFSTHFQIWLCIPKMAQYLKAVFSLKCFFLLLIIEKWKFPFASTHSSNNRTLNSTRCAGTLHPLWGGERGLKCRERKLAAILFLLNEWLQCYRRTWQADVDMDRETFILKY